MSVLMDSVLHGFQLSEELIKSQSAFFLHFKHL